MYAWCAVATELGSFTLASTDDGLISVSAGRDPTTTAALARRGPVRPAVPVGAAPVDAPPARGHPALAVAEAAPADLVLATAGEQLREYAAGKRTQFTVALDWSLTTGVQ